VEQLLIAFVLLVLGFLAYRFSIFRHPYTKCETCNGTGKHKGGVFNYAHRPCHKCSGVGQKQRWGARQFNRGYPRRGTTKTPGPGG
jgi:DnaJ-class molecular chaperone